MTTQNPLQELWRFRQSPWYDNLSRQMFSSGELVRMIREDGLRGITSNPTIFDKAISGSKDYDDSISDLVLRGISDSQAVFEAIAVQDIQKACDLLSELYRSSGGTDGFVSLEVSPNLAHDTLGTIHEARHLHSLVSRPNVMIKVPATKAGIPAIEALIGEGINVNVTLIFSNDRYESVATAYIAGLERLAKSGKPLESVNSVASFFVSRIDTAVDKELEERIADQKKSGGSIPYQLLFGRVAVANAKVAYQRFKGLFSSPRFKALEQRGAKVQRVLWASTGTKNPKYSDVLYVEELIGSDTINTIPPATWAAFREHGKVRPSLEEGLQDAKDVLDQLKEFGIRLDQITDRLEQEGVKAFIDSYSSLLKSVSAKALMIAAASGASSNPSLFEKGAEIKAERLIRDEVPRRIFEKDASIWKQGESGPEVIGNSLGWISLPATMGPKLAEIDSFVQEVRDAGYSHALLLGMGGSSLAPEVFRRTFETKAGFLKLTVLDSTDPEAVSEIARQLPPDKTIYLVSSKSGTTIEPLRLYDYFYAQAEQKLGAEAGKHFAAISDPGSSLEKLAREKGFRRVFLNPADVGGRYSALSFFGLVPAALMGVDIKTLLTRTGKMACMCAAQTVTGNPGLSLAASLASYADVGRDKITIIIPPALSGLDLWLEQLLAESLGKQGVGIVPVSGERLLEPAKYGKDRVFVFIGVGAKKVDVLSKLAEDVRKAGHPTIELILQDSLDLGPEFYRWEIATAVLGHLQGINPFDQPNVQQAKDLTKRLLEQLVRRGSLPSFPNQAEENNQGSSIALSLSNAALPKQSASPMPFDRAVQGIVRSLKPGDYLSLLPYVSINGRYENALKDLQSELGHASSRAVQFGYGPRYLHSTGQLHKGGPNTGVFILLVREDQPKVDVPGASYSFGQLEYAQCLGDFQALGEAGRRAALVRFQGDPLAAIQRLSRIISPVSAAA